MNLVAETSVQNNIRTLFVSKVLIFILRRYDPFELNSTFFCVLVKALEAQTTECTILISRKITEESS